MLLRTSLAEARHAAAMRELRRTPHTWHPTVPWRNEPKQPRRRARRDHEQGPTS